ncbi:MAG: ABC transporter substrate-binding protein, partial [Pseudomonadota bacterium]
QRLERLSVAVGEMDQQTGLGRGQNELFVPPFENYFGHRTGMAWAEWVDSDGSAGVEPPAWVKEMMADIEAFQAATPGTDESNALGAKLAQSMAEQVLFIGTVQAPNPIYVRNGLQNVPEFQTWSYEYYRTYPYRATQWFLAEDN